MSTSVEIAIHNDEVLEELNALVVFAHERLVGLSEDAMERKKTAQLLAVGLLWRRWLADNTKESAEIYEKSCDALVGYLRRIG